MKDEQLQVVSGIVLRRDVVTCGAYMLCYRLEIEVVPCDVEESCDQMLSHLVMLRFLTIQIG